MIGEYPISFCGEQIGDAVMYRQGLYYRICCRCKPSGDVPVRIKVIHQMGETDLGLCVPMESGFGIDTRIPVKRIGESITEFRAIVTRGERNTFFVTVSSSEPFRYIGALKDACLVHRGQEVGVLLPFQREMSNPTGQ